MPHRSRRQAASHQRRSLLEALSATECDHEFWQKLTPLLVLQGKSFEEWRDINKFILPLAKHLVFVL